MTDSLLPGIANDTWIIDEQEVEEKDIVRTYRLDLIEFLFDQMKVIAYHLYEYAWYYIPNFSSMPYNNSSFIRHTTLHIEYIRLCLHKLVYFLFFFTSIATSARFLVRYII